ncbi:glycogen debranching enzyme, putative [Alkalithermobacter thermoalcaliphilus JW-YL-7 = DSM 7308]|uniref:Glycogen debranching enzyme n=1 Tax=Alkalithermobacter thermoalcaliphilus JW-YL-7 = DSM 7308 TaxID=1121328 RepID=A0A150FSR0_CLOPD|nr:glycogen debranching enzyme [[Clostridium] paradoxum JW-YL-7 = DSM 7308]SHL20206.1 glycogen debranching enzyme, putative [[Clostridium] paradoxum JW-YL-7 = DSM 7308]
MRFGKKDWKTYESGIQKEWILTNGLGGFASSTIVNCNIRKYNALLNVSLNPPINRTVLLSKLDEEIIIGDKSYYLGTNKTVNGIKNKGYLYLQQFIFEDVPKFIYSVEDIFIEKEIALVYKEDKVVVTYEIESKDSSFIFRLYPFTNYKDHHQNSKKNDFIYKQFEIENGVRLNLKENEKINIYIKTDIGEYIQSEKWFEGMYYDNEEYRGLDPIDYHFIPGYFEVKINPNTKTKISFIASTKDFDDLDGFKMIQNVKQRYKDIVKKAHYEDEFANKLVRACDDFLVYRKSTNTKTVIAGYPWFTDWGRDTMISLTGLTLLTKRFDDAKEILLTFINYLDQGLIPNMFPDEGYDPLYNTVDGTLWYFYGVYKYLEYTKDYDFVKNNIYSKLKEIINYHINGTKYNIKMDNDFLITAGEKGTQLTWMDAKVDDWVVTERHGKAVEINALWYNALKVMEYLCKEFKEDYSYYEDIALKVKENFNKLFWNEDKKYLYDVINENIKDDKIRPNAIFAVSLPYSVLDSQKHKYIVDRVYKELYATYGIRSLSPYEDEYIGVYGGNRYKRDAAYHQGTTWAWLIGHFITAYVKVYGKSDNLIKKFIDPFKDHIKDQCVGQIAEIFDGNEPIIPRGCFAQAWSVAEILRCYVEDLI